MEKGNIRTIFTSTSCEESREVRLWSDEEGITIEERTEGQLTAAIYHEPFHVQRMLVKPLCLAGAAYILGTDPEGLPRAIQRFFEIEPCRQLVDLMDYLDMNDIPYDYHAFGEREGCFRPSQHLR